MALTGRQFGHPCAGPKCTAKWDGDKSWATCWCCPGGPLAFCKDCRGHFNTAACLGSHRKRGVADDVVDVLVIEVAA